jgi:iron complex outermembrane receptor protein
VVRDDESKQPLVGANVIVRGTVVGAATDRRGEFRLSRVPAGRHALVVSMVGYERKVVEDLTLTPGQEVRVEIELRAVPIQTEQIVITASRREQSLQDVPVSVSTVTAEIIALRNHVTLDDALRYVPGVNLLQDQVNIRGSTGYSRGVGSRVLLLLDGLPFLTGDTGEINWEVIPVYEVERLEVVKGAGSALYGSSALGGVINVLTRSMQEGMNVRFRLYSGMYDKPRFREWEWDSKARFNSGVALSLSHRTGAFGYLVSMHRSVDESYRQNDASHRWSLYGKVRYDLSSSQTITLSANLLQRVRGNFFWWKSLRDATRPPESQLDGRVESLRGNVGLSYKEFISEKFLLTVKAMYYGNDWEDYKREIRNYYSRSHLFQGDVQGTYEFSPKNILTFGVAGNYDMVDANLFGKHPGAGAALYVQDELEMVDRWKVTVGARLDWQKVSVLPSTTQLDPKIGIVYTLSAETRLRASFGSGFRYPSISELYIESPKNISQIPIVPNAQLKVEQSTSVEVGFNSRVGAHLVLDGAVFSSSFTNLIEPAVAFTENNEPYIQFDNVTRARIQGGEMAVNIDWWKRVFTTQIGYTYIWPRDLTENALLKFRPRHILYATGSFVAEPFQAGVDFRYVSRIDRIDENLVRFAPIPQGEQRVAIKVVDVRCLYTTAISSLPFRIGFNVNNLFNYHYVELIGNLAPVRTYFLTIEGAIE